MLKLRNIIKGFDFKEKNMRNNLKIRPDIKFYDTEALYLSVDYIKNNNDKFIISSITYNYLINDDSPISKMLLNIINTTDRCEIVYNNDNYNIEDIKLRIMSDADFANNIIHPDEIIFITGNASLIENANQYFGDSMIKLI